MVRAWYMIDIDDSEDKCLPQQMNPSEFLSIQDLKDKLMVEYWFFDPNTYENDKEFKELKQNRGYTYQDLIEVSPSKLANYDKMLESFFVEHIHTDEEIRYVLDGSGYFDARDSDDKWIRIEVTRGDMIVLPAGIYHRFTLDTNHHIKALRLFIGEPKWTPYPRAELEPDNDSVIKYKQRLRAK